MSKRYSFWQIKYFYLLIFSSSILITVSSKTIFICWSHSTLLLPSSWPDKQCLYADHTPPYSHLLGLTNNVYMLITLHPTLIFLAWQTMFICWSHSTLLSSSWPDKQCLYADHTPPYSHLLGLTNNFGSLFCNAAHHTPNNCFILHNYINLFSIHFYYIPVLMFLYTTCIQFLSFTFCVCNLVCVVFYVVSCICAKILNCTVVSFYECHIISSLPRRSVAPVPLYKPRNKPSSL